MIFPHLLKEKLSRGSHRDIPILIPSFNNPGYCRMMVHQLLQLGLTRITIIDNASSAPAMLALLRDMDTKINVIRLRRNMGPKFFAQNFIFFLQLPNIFCVTDPDIEFNPDLPPSFLETLQELTERHQIGKAGFALNIADHYEFRDIQIKFKDQTHDIVSWESQFWTQEIGATAAGDPVYRADIDTTFALYNKKFFGRKKQGFYHGLRVAGNFTARHLPWYRERVITEAEENSYAATQKFSWYAKN